MTLATDLAADSGARLAARLATAHARDALAEKLDEVGAVVAWTGSVTRDPSSLLIVSVALSPATGGDGWVLTPTRVDGVISEFTISRQPEEV